ncbi:MAG: hypothetical protein NTX48_16035 [Planctomycetales bacterium]|nr:hypothetical protein [Planctomycetales bacterium]
MPIPNAEHALIAEEKIRDYLRNPSHPVGGSKAVWFASIGYTMVNWQDLANDLLQVVQTSEDFIAKLSPFGVKYEVSGALGCPGHRLGVVVSVWIVEENDPPRLVTAYLG